MMSLEQAQELRNTSLWKYVKLEIDHRIFCKLNELKICTPENLPLIQAQMKVYEEFLRLPDDVIEREEEV